MPISSLAELLGEAWGRKDHSCEVTVLGLREDEVGGQFPTLWFYSKWEIIKLSRV